MPVLGGGKRARTADLLAASQTLSQLSYTPTDGYAGLRGRRPLKYTIEPRARNMAAGRCPPSRRPAGRPRACLPLALTRPGILSPRIGNLGRCKRVRSPRSAAGGTRRRRAAIHEGPDMADRDDRYRPQEIETRWQAIWRERDAYRTSDDSSRPKFYCLDFFPYPSGDGLSVGHCRNYVPTDASRGFRACAASTCCTRWARTRSGCRPRTTRSRRA